jgi:hypothetical protein
MRISSSQGHGQTAPQADAQPARLSAGERARIYQQVFGAPGGATDGAKPNREFEDLWLRFVSSVAQLGRQEAQPLVEPAAKHGPAVQELATKAGSLVDAALATRDQWQVIDQVGAMELGGAANHTRYRTMAEAGGAILEWLAQHADGSHTAQDTDMNLLDAVEQWLAVSGVPDAAVESMAQPKETVAAWAQQLYRAVGLEDDTGQRVQTPRIAALFSGPSGTGKSLAAHWLATALDVNVYRVDLGRVVSQYIGETEKNLQAVFRDAEKSGAVLLLDEADALFGKRSEMKDSHNRYANIEVNYLLQRMESFAGVAILTSNSNDAIDPDVLKRLKVVAFPIPPR